MNLFHIIDDAVVILRSKGVYRQVKVYRRGVELYAQHGAGFVKLARGGGTSLPNVTWLEVEGPGIELRAGLPSYDWVSANKPPIAAE